MTRLMTIILLLFMCPFYVFSGGSNGDRWPGPGEMRLNIINQTNDELKIFFNTNDVSVIIKGKNNYNSETLLMDFDNTYPLFIGIEFINNSMEYFIFKREIPAKKMNRLFYVIVNDRRVYFFDESYHNLIEHLINFDGNFDGDFLFDANRFSSDEWRRYNAYGTRYNCLEILVINDTRIKMNIIFNDSVNELHYTLDVGEARLIKIMDPIFLQGNRYSNINYRYYSIETENLLHTNGIYRVPIRLEDGLQIKRMVENEGGIIIMNR